MKICPYCLSAITDDEDRHQCERCGADHHADCWGETGRCSVFGCADSTEDLPSEDSATTPQPTVQQVITHAPDDQYRVAATHDPLSSPPRVITDPTSPSTTAQPTPAAISADKPRSAQPMIWSIAGVLLVLTIITFSTADRWEKVDIPEHKETFHTETYETGLWVVKEYGGNPCWVGQNWTDCSNTAVSEYNGSCVGVHLTTQSWNLCSAYSDMIDDMQSRGGWGYTVARLGGWERLTRSPETKIRSVSNNDYRPAVTHEAVCYLGFIGECRDT